uniref:Minor capsid protein P9 transmembrane helices domain-containing protein n=1 Tax=viral metagenome TaxID=1070528 RepID=A0A6C0AR89_9ZZZZ
MTISFWTNEPTILFNKEYIFELWPTTDMCYEQKLNAITRLVILITILGYILTMSKRILLVGVVTLVVIFVLFKMRKEKVTKEMVNEGFKVLTRENTEQGEPSFVNPVTLESVLKSEFKEGTKKNPFSNVLLTQIEDDPERKSAPPSFNVDVDEDITKNVKRSVQMMNPGIKNTNKQLFGDLWQQFELDQSNRVFYSTPNTRVQPGDQPSFGQYLYGSMYSAKESTPEGAFARVQDNYRYTLY